MAIRKLRLTPAQATCTLGARLASSGGGLPARVTDELDRYFASIITASSGVQFDPDGNFWVVHSTNGLLKINATTGAVMLTVTTNTAANRNIVTAQSLTRRGTKLYFASSGAGTYLGEYDMVSGTCELYSQVQGGDGAVVVAAPYHVVGSETGKCWARTGATTSGTYTEFVLTGTGNTATATTTARTVATAWDCVGDNAGFLYFALSASLTKYNLSTGAVDVTYTPTSGTVGDWPGAGTNLRQLAWDSIASKLLFGCGGSSVGSTLWYRLNAGLTEVTERVFGFVEFTGFAAGSNTTFHRSPVAFSDDGRLWAYTATGVSGAPSAPVSVRIATVGPQRATWTWTPASLVVVDEVVASGARGLQIGAIESVPTSPPMLNNVYTFERVKFFYSLSGGVSDQPLSVDDDQLALTVGAGQTLTVYAVFQRNIDDLAGPRVWLGSNSGVALRINYNVALPRLGSL